MTHPIQIELPTGLAVGPVNAYLFTQPEPILVDAGIKTEACLQALEAGLAAQGLSIAELSKVIISHPHIDHCGLAGIIVEQSQADIYIFEPAKPWLTDYQGMAQRRVAYYRDDLFIYWGLYADFSQPILDYYFGIRQACDDLPVARVKTFQAEELLTMGGVPWRVLYTPGHDINLTCFYQADTQQFLSADMLLPLAPTPIPDAPPQRQRRMPSLPQFLASLDVVEGLECEVIYPGHGDPFMNHRELIARQRARIEQRKTECFDLIKQGYTRLGEITQTMYAHYKPQLRFAGLWMALGYVDLLVAEGKVALIEYEEAGKISVTLTSK